jgi:Dehydratase family
VLSFPNTSTASSSIKCFSDSLDSCIFHVSYAPLSSWLRAQRCLPTSVPWGQNNDILVCTFAGPKPVVLVVVAHQLNPSLTRASGAPACPVPNRKVRSVGTRPRGTGRLEVWRRRPGGCKQPGHHDANVSIPGCDKNMPGVIMAALFENTLYSG